MSDTIDRDALQNPLEARLAALEASEQGSGSKKKKKKKKKVTEQGSTRGTSNTEINAGAERVMQPLRIKLRTATLAGNKAMADKFRQRLLALQATKL